MRNWLFFKRISKSEIEFRRVNGGGEGNPHTWITAPLNDVCHFAGDPPTEKDIETFVRRCGWAGEHPRSYDHPVAQAILRGRW